MRGHDTWNKLPSQFRQQAPQIAFVVQAFAAPAAGFVFELRGDLFQLTLPRREPRGEAAQVVLTIDHPLFHFDSLRLQPALFDGQAFGQLFELEPFAEEVARFDGDRVRLAFAAREVVLR
jgi:hypothetical protein